MSKARTHRGHRHRGHRGHRHRHRRRHRGRGRRHRQYCYLVEKCSLTS